MAACRSLAKDLSDQAVKHEIEQSVIEARLDKTAGNVWARLRFDADLTVFLGHFPELALVPGIYLIEATRVLAERWTGATLEIEEVANARFTAEVHPGDELTAKAVVSTSEAGLICEASFEMGDVKAARVRLVLRGA